MNIKSKDSFFLERPLSEWDFPNYLAYYKRKNSQKTKKTLENAFLYQLKAIARDPSTSEELKDSINKIIKKTENKDKSEDKSTSRIQINGSVISSNFNIGASSSSSTIIERQTTEKAVEVKQTTAEEQISRDEIDDFFNPLPNHNAANKRRISQTEDMLYDSLSRPIIIASQVRQEVYQLGVKRMCGPLSQTEVFTLEKWATALKPTTMGETLDLMAAKLILELDSTDIHQVNALKLSLSRTVSLANSSTLNIFQKHIQDESFWKEVEDMSIEFPPAMPVALEDTFNQVINASKDTHGKVTLKKLRLSISKEKVKAIEEDKDDVYAILDIMEIIARHAVSDDKQAKENESELTSYRRIAQTLDVIMEDLSLDLLDGETTCKISKTIAKDHEALFGGNIPLNKGFGRRIDLLLSSKNIELSTNEWKRKKATKEQCLIQQAKNIRMNKAILSRLLALPLTEDDSQSVFTLGMDWVGPRGYMFAVKKLNDIYIAKHTHNLSVPEYLHQVPSYLSTLKNLYIWKDHHARLQSIISTAVLVQEDEDFFSSIASGAGNAGSSKELSPNIYLTPVKTKKND